MPARHSICGISSLLTRRSLCILVDSGVSTICYLRDVFPEEDFESIKFNNQPLKTIKGREDSDAKELINWLEDGAFEALRYRYLEKMSLCIFDAPPSQPDAVMLEDHSFAVIYPYADDQPGLHVMQTAKSTGKTSTYRVDGADKPVRRSVPNGAKNKSEIKKQTTIFIRTIITVLNGMKRKTIVQSQHLRACSAQACADAHMLTCC
jgi:hypothetical protein